MQVMAASMCGLEGRLALSAGDNCRQMESG